MSDSRATRQSAQQAAQRRSAARGGHLRVVLPLRRSDLCVRHLHGTVCGGGRGGRAVSRPSGINHASDEGPNVGEHASCVHRTKMPDLWTTVSPAVSGLSRSNISKKE